MQHKCELKGFLSFLVLRLIGKKPMSGDELRDELEKRKGCRPSPGTIYPVLKELRTCQFIQEIKGSGKIKKYKLTKQGTAAVNEATHRFIEMFHDMKEEFAKSKVH